MHLTFFRWRTAERKLSLIGDLHVRLLACGHL
jgi:hypothetical protein